MAAKFQFLTATSTRADQKILRIWLPCQNQFRLALGCGGSVAALWIEWLPSSHIPVANRTCSSSVTFPVFVALIMEVLTASIIRARCTHRNDARCSKHLRNVSLLRDYKAQYARRLSYWQRMSLRSSRMYQLRNHSVSWLQEILRSMTSQNMYNQLLVCPLNLSMHS
jgi:hypothetical protein